MFSTRLHQFSPSSVLAWRLVHGVTQDSPWISDNTLHQCHIGLLMLRLRDLFQNLFWLELKTVAVLTGCPLVPMSPFLPWSPVPPSRPFIPEVPLSPGSPGSP